MSLPRAFEPTFRFYASPLTHVIKAGTPCTLSWWDIMGCLSMVILRTLYWPSHFSANLSRSGHAGKNELFALLGVRIISGKCLQKRTFCTPALTKILISDNVSCLCDIRIVVRGEVKHRRISAWSRDRKLAAFWWGTPRNGSLRWTRLSFRKTPRGSPCRLSPVPYSSTAFLFLATKISPLRSEHHVEHSGWKMWDKRKTTWQMRLSCSCYP